MIFFSLEILQIKGKGGVKMQEFYCKTKIISGEGSLNWLKGREYKSLLLVTDPFFMENGWAERIAGMVKAETMAATATASGPPRVLDRERPMMAMLLRKEPCRITPRRSARPAARAPAG